MRGCDDLKTVKLSSSTQSDAVIGRGALSSAAEYLNLQRRVFVLTDREVPHQYVDDVCLNCLYPVRVSVWPGEDVNSIENYEQICQIMLDNNFESDDCIVAIGGERVLNLAGFVSATFKGGIERYCIPTTFSSQIGGGFFGRSYISLNKKQNALGADKPPRRVLVDANLLKTLSERQMADGIAEAIRLALLFDKKLFDYIEKEDLSREKTIDYIVSRAIEIKNYIYRNQDEMPKLCKALSFGDIIADGMEKTKFSYGERLAIGMLPMCSGDAKVRLRGVFSKVGLPVVWQYDVERLFRDSLKGNDSEKISLVLCNEIGEHRVDKLTIPEYHKLIKNAYGG